MKDVNFDHLKDHEKNVNLLFDEIRVKSGLVYSRQTGELVGFTDLGTLNNELLKLTEGLQPQEATYMVAFMIRGTCASYKAVVGHYPTQKTTGYHLYNLVWNVVYWLEYAGFNVRAVVSDGASANRKFYRIHKSEDEELCHAVVNKHAKSRKLYFMCDVPHLIKTTRNNWENSHWNSQTRNLKVNINS